MAKKKKKTPPSLGYIWGKRIADILVFIFLVSILLWGMDKSKMEDLIKEFSPASPFPVRKVGASSTGVSVKTSVRSALGLRIAQSAEEMIGRYPYGDQSCGPYSPKQCHVCTDLVVGAYSRAGVPISTGYGKFYTKLRWVPSMMSYFKGGSVSGAVSRKRGFVGVSQTLPQPGWVVFWQGGRSHVEIVHSVTQLAPGRYKVTTVGALGGWNEGIPSWNPRKNIMKTSYVLQGSPGSFRFVSGNAYTSIVGYGYLPEAVSSSASYPSVGEDPVLTIPSNLTDRNGRILKAGTYPVLGASMIDGDRLRAEWKARSGSAQYENIRRSWSYLDKGLSFVSGGKTFSARIIPPGETMSMEEVGYGAGAYISAGSVPGGGLCGTCSQLYEASAEAGLGVRFKNYARHDCYPGLSCKYTCTYWLGGSSSRTLWVTNNKPYTVAVVAVFDTHRSFVYLIKVS